MRLFSLPTLITSFLLFSSIIAVPVPEPGKKRPHSEVDDGIPQPIKQPQDVPLPGRSGTSVDANGVVTGRKYNSFVTMINLEIGFADLILSRLWR